MYSKILVPTDGSTISTVAARHANELARAFEAEIFVLCVQETVGVTESISNSAERYPNDEEAQDSIDLVTERLDEDIDTTEFTMVGGSVAKTILEYAHEQDIDLVVMGTTGRTGAERFLIGSVAEKIVRQSKVPVTTVRETS